MGADNNPTAQSNFNAMFGEIGFSIKEEKLVATDSLVDFHDHLFPPYEENALLQLMDSIEAKGLYEALLVRRHNTMDNKYEILSGHNRAEAFRRLGIKDVPVRIFTENLTDDEAKLIVIDTNLTHRGLNELKISERMNIVTVWYRLWQDENIKLRLLGEVGQEILKKKDDGTERFSLGPAQISRYIRLNDNLADSLKEKMDDGKLNILAGVELSFIEIEEQELVNDAINDGKKISSAKAIAIRKMSGEVAITKNTLDDLLTKKKNVEEEKKKSYKLTDEMIEKYFKEDSEDEIKATVELALENYFRA